MNDLDPSEATVNVGEEMLREAIKQAEDFRQITSDKATLPPDLVIEAAKTYLELTPLLWGILLAKRRLEYGGNEDTFFKKCTELSEKIEHILVP